MDPIIDLIIRIKNGYSAKRETVESPHSKYREAVLKKLVALGYVKEYQVEGEGIKNLKISLSYDSGSPAVTGIKVGSRPGRRWYSRSKNLKSILGGMGYSILSTPEGIMTNKEANKKNIGGELLFQIW